MGKKKDQKKSTKHANEGFGVETAAATAAPAEKKPAKAKASGSGSGVATADIALRAYFISEKRRSQGLHGTEHHDWVEAERQLTAEQKKPRKKSAEV